MVARRTLNTSWLLAAFLLVSALPRAADVWRPVDGTTWNTWREVDVAAIARNFYREGGNILLPRIDWRGDGPGFVESEFPLYPWTVAGMYRLFGPHEELARLLSLGLAMATSVVFFFLARMLLPPAGLLGALAFWAVNPLGARMATSVQPEPLMALAVLAAVYFFALWLRDARWRLYAVALFFTVLAVLAKLPALYLGVFFAALVLDRFGLRALRRLDVWAFAAVTVLATLLWYLHARDLFRAYGNSLGASNEAYRFITWSGFIDNARWTIPGNLRNEIGGVWTVPGALLGVLGLAGRRGDGTRRFVLLWLAALATFYLVAGRTTGQQWALYYHVASIPAAALAIGLGVDEVARAAARWECPRATASLALVVSIATIAGSLLVAVSMRRWVRPALAASTAVAVSWLVYGTLRSFSGLKDPAGEPSRGSLGWIALPGCLLLASTLTLEAFRVFREAHPRYYVGLYNCAQSFARKVDPGALIVASGGAPTTTGAQALDAPYFFYWMDRKGFSLAKHSLDDLERFRARGGRYFVVEREFLDRDPGFEHVLRARFPPLEECGGNILLQLDAR